MKHLRSYDSQAKAELDLSLLQANRIDAVLSGSDAATLGDALQRELRLAVPEEQHTLALAILADEAEQTAEAPAPAEAASGPHQLAVVIIRVSALFFFVNALIYLTYIGEYSTRISEAKIEFVNPYRVRVLWDIARMAYHIAMGGLLFAYAEPLARIVCWGLGRRAGPGGER